MFTFQRMFKEHGGLLWQGRRSREEQARVGFYASALLQYLYCRRVNNMMMIPDSLL